MHNLQDSQSGNFCTTSAALTGLSGAATTYSTGALALNYAIKGQLFVKAQVSGGTTPIVDGSTGASMTLSANQAALFVWAVNAAGTVAVFKGPTKAWTDTSALSTECPRPMTISDLWTPFAEVIVKAGATTVGNWVFGTSNWNATGIVVDPVKNLAVYTAEPQLTA
jgi:hypothetical protein